ncbi:unnamed protein product, partial [Oppiella nova]
MALTYWCFICEPTHPSITDESVRPLISDSNDMPSLVDSGGGDETHVLPQNTSHSHELTAYERTVFVIKLLKYMIPLMMVYLFEYFINQGLFELVYFPHIWLSHREQYRWYNVDYQIGVLISRSSLSFVKIRKLYVLAILQFINVLVVLTQIWLKFMPNIWVMLALVLFEGLLGGAAYVNTFHRIYTEVNDKYKEFALSITTLSDSVGITIAG